jgi:hypothetical protein
MKMGLESKTNALLNFQETDLLADIQNVRLYNYIKLHA